MAGTSDVFDQAADSGDVFDEAELPKHAGPKPMSAPKASDFAPDPDTLPNFISGAGTGVANFAQGLYNTVLHPINAVEGIGHTIGDTYRSTRGDIKGGTPGQIPLDLATGVSRIAGFDEPRLAQLWNEGQGSRAIGEATPMAVADAVGAEKVARRGPLTVNGASVADIAKKGLSRISLGDQWKVPGTPINIRLRQPLQDRFGNEIQIPGAESEMQSDIAKGQQERAAAHAQMEADLEKARQKALPGPELGTPDNPGWVVNLPDRMPAPPKSVDPVLQAVREGRASKIPTRLPAPEPELGSPENPGWMAKLPDRVTPQEDPLAVAVREGRAAKLPTTIAPPTDPVTSAVREGRAMRLPMRIAAPEPEPGTPQNPGWVVKLPDRMPVERTATERPTIAVTGGEGPIGSGPTERQVQTLMQKPILTPDEQAFVERVLGPNARMKSGEGLTKWRNRVTGNLKAARARTE
jgi:hypothetical protein